MNIKHFSVLLARIALCLIYVWFGALKVIGQSPATPLVKNLLAHTLPFFPLPSFLVLFGLFEMLIGILWMWPGMEKLAMILFAVHMVTTILPIFILPQYVWTHLFVPTLEGQYIIKNIALIACAAAIAASRKSPRERDFETGTI